MARFTIACALLLLVGCTSHLVRLRGVDPLNVNAAGESTPVDVRIYPLRTLDRFQSIPFESLWTDGERLLASDLTGAPTVVTVTPAAAGDPPQRVVITVEAPWYGVLALVRKGDGSPRTAVIAAKDLGAVTVEVRGYGLRIDGATP